MIRFIRIVVLIAVTVLISTVVFVAVVNIHVVSFSRKYIFDSPEELALELKSDSQAAIVLGAMVYSDGTPCAMLQDRLDAAISVTDSGLTDILLLSGDHGTRGYDEVNSMKNYIFNKGFTSESVFLDHAGFSTYDSMVRAARIFMIETAIVSTQEFHLYRAIYIGRKNGIEVWGIKADLRKYPGSEMTRYTIREWLARTKDFIYVHILNPDPIFLGEKIPITGESSASYD